MVVSTCTSMGKILCTPRVKWNAYYALLELFLLLFIATKYSTTLSNTNDWINPTWHYHFVHVSALENQSYWFFTNSFTVLQIRRKTQIAPKHMIQLIRIDCCIHKKRFPSSATISVGDLDNANGCKMWIIDARSPVSLHGWKDLDTISIQGIFM